MTQTERLEHFIRDVVRHEVRTAILDLYERMGYDAATSMGCWQSRDCPRPLDDNWVNETSHR